MRSRRIGVWTLSTLATDAGGWRSINRVGLPMVHPLFTQYNEDLGNRLNAGSPTGDRATHGPSVAKAIAGVVAAYGTAEDPRAYGEKSRGDSAPTFSFTKSAQLPHSVLPNGTVARLQTTRPMSCSRWRPTLPLVSVSAKNP